MNQLFNPKSSEIHGNPFFCDCNALHEEPCNAGPLARVQCVPEMIKTLERRDDLGLIGLHPTKS